MPTPAPARSPRPSAKKRPFDIDEVFRRLREAVSPSPGGHVRARRARASTRRSSCSSPASSPSAPATRRRSRSRRRAVRARPHPARPCAGSSEERDRRADPRLHLPRAQGAADPRHRPPRRGRSTAASCPATREVLLVLRGRRPQVRQPRARHRLRPGPHRRRRPRPPRHQPLGLRRRRRPPRRRWPRSSRSCPRGYWVEINRLLVPFGKHVCTGMLPEVLDLPGARHVPAGGRRRSTADGQLRSPTSQWPSSLQKASVNIGYVGSQSSHATLWHPSVSNID